MTTDTVLKIAKQFTFVRETPAGSNAGRWVEAVQRISGSPKGSAWCASFVSLVLGIAFKDKPPIPYTASCDELLTVAARWDWLVDGPESGDIFLVMKTPSDAVHTGFVTSVVGSQFNTIEGNASDPSKPATREGWGVWERTRKLEHGKYRFIRYPRGA